MAARPRWWSNFTVVTTRTPLFNHYALLSAVLAFSGYLIFKNLGDVAVWNDEAETAIIAKNFLKTGHFTGWDGRNFQGIRNGSLLDKNLNDRNPPMQFILTALSFAVFGANNFTARLPFALIGFLTVILLYCTLRSEIPERPAFALYATAFLGLSTEYILYARNCRYYSIACCAALLAFFAFRGFMRHANIKASLWLAGSAVLLYYSHFLICITFLIPLAILNIFFERKRLSRKHWILLLSVCLLFAAATVPYTVLHRYWDRPDMPKGYFFLTHLVIMLWNFRDSLASGIAPWSIVAASLALMMTRSLEPKVNMIVKLSLLVLIGHIALIGLTSSQGAAIYKGDPAMTTISKEFLEKRPMAVLRFLVACLPFSTADIRYLVACFPCTAILAGGIFHWLHTKSKRLAPCAAALLIGSNMACFLPWHNPRSWFPHPLVYSPLYEYMNEIHHHYPTGVAAVSEYLNDNAKRDETFFAWPDDKNGPIGFYTGSRLINCCLLDTDTYLGADKVRSLSPFLLKSDNFPDWLILFGAGKDREELLEYFSRTVKTRVASFDNDYECAANLPVFCDETTNPQIFWRHFGAVTGFDSLHHVFVFHKAPRDSTWWLHHFPQILSGEKAFCAHSYLPVKTFIKLYELYAHDTALVTNVYSHGQIDEYFRPLLKWLLENKIASDADRVRRTMAKLEPDNGYYHQVKKKGRTAL